VTAILETVDLQAGYGRAGYGRDTIVVRDLCLTVEAGEIVALLGPNGAGKTTTLMTLAGELEALGGEILFDGQSATGLPLYKRARAGMGLVTERRSVFTELTVAENLRVSRCSESRALEMFPELRDHLNRSAGLLSGGQQQILALARALTRGEPRLLLIDELSLGLAPQVVDRLLRVVTDAKARGVGVLVVEQHIHKALAIADRIYVMRRGRIELSGQAQHFAKDIEAIKKSYLTSDVVTLSDADVPNNKTHNGRTADLK
jgi:ABC-type branched-subunit amino acid transport system ATPase component